jgi:predicted dehydrogenase
MTRTPLRLGIIGTGLAVEKLHWPALNQMPDRYRVTAFANRGRDNAERFAGYSGTSMDAFVPDYQDLLRRDDVDAVLISLPIPLNQPVTQAALEAGKHVICEKPPGATESEGRALLDTVSRHPDQVILIAENYFYRDDLRFTRSLLDDGAIGRVHLVAWRKISQLVPQPGEFSGTPWRQEAKYEGGPHLDAGVHDTAQLRMLCGDAMRVHGELQDANSTHNGPSDLAMNLRFVSGAVGTYTASYPELAMPEEPNDMRLYGTEAVMSVGNDATRIFRPDGTVETYRVEQQDAGYYNEFSNFYDAVVDGAPVIGTVNQSVRNMEIILRGLKSARQGQVIKMDPGPESLSTTAVPLWRPPGASDLGVKVTREVTQAGGC